MVYSLTCNTRPLALKNSEAKFKRWVIQNAF